MSTLREFEGTTIAVRSAAEPKNKPEVFVVELVTDGVSRAVLKSCNGGPQRRLEMPGDMLLTGGELEGHIIEGISPEEVRLRADQHQYEDPFQTPPYEPNWERIAEFWATPPDDKEPFPTW